MLIFLDLGENKSLFMFKRRFRFFAPLKVSIKASSDTHGFHLTEYIVKINAFVYFSNLQK